ncbi:hypothetical protein D9619_005410 [Psilocybe cf. subviscida]|uniref:Uncharacterized protein n=1 Tax=Psilocybe cf. subviscida TaxID=2480587 RepID=A0A8H5BYP0_9AGAR|nr:hypothetical protein D9619_005410 [Psilocybe cf. subviscida]
MSLSPSSIQSAGSTISDLAALDGFGVRGSFIGVIISAILYGIAVLISVACLRLLVKSKQIYDSKRRLIALSLHICFMLACGTEALVSESWLALSATEQKLSIEAIRIAASAVVPGMTSSFVGAGSSTTVDLLPITLPVAVWGADGFLIWRCLVLYGEIGRVKRAILYTFLGSLALMKLICGCIFYYYISPAHASSSVDKLLAVQLLVLSSTSAGNILVSVLITARLLYAERLSAAFQNPDLTRADSPYMKALVICVESSGMIAIVALVGVVATVTLPHEYSQISPMILPQLCVISPLLIVYRIARGRESHLIRQADTQVADTPIAFTNATTYSMSSSKAEHGGL